MGKIIYALAVVCFVFGCCNLNKPIGLIAIVVATILAGVANAKHEKGLKGVRN